MTSFFPRCSTAIRYKLLAFYSFILRHQYFDSNNTLLVISLLFIVNILKSFSMNDFLFGKTKRFLLAIESIFNYLLFGLCCSWLDRPVGCFQITDWMEYRKASPLWTAVCLFSVVRECGNRAILHFFQFISLILEYHITSLGSIQAFYEAFKGP